MSNENLSQFQRAQLLLGKNAMEKLFSAHIIIFGIGGVGSFAAEAIARAGVGKITLVDNDTVSLTNLNRQLVALHSTIGKQKTEIMRERILDINPDCEVVVRNCFFNAETATEFDFSQYDYVVDCIDTITSKILLVQLCAEVETPIISSMGTGNKLAPTMFEITDIYKTTVCPLARVMRHELKARGIKRLKVLYSKEQPLTPKTDEAQTLEIKGRNTIARTAPGSISFVPSVAGLIIGGEVIKDIAARAE